MVPFKPEMGLFKPEMGLFKHEMGPFSPGMDPFRPRMGPFRHYTGPLRLTKGFFVLLFLFDSSGHVEKNSVPNSPSFRFWSGCLWASGSFAP